MQPQYQIEADTYSIPKMDIGKAGIDGFMDKLDGFHFEFADCFGREAARQKFYQYMVGQLSELQRKSIEPIALQVEGARARNIQRLMCDTTWDEELMLSKYHSMVNSDIGDDDGVLIFNESGFIKKGNDSVGVARQYCETTGRVDNCQLGVFMAYASRHGYAFLDKRLFIPEKWFTDDYASRREKNNLPESVVFKTKPQLATEMFKELSKECTLPFKSVVADALYGNCHDFIEAIEAIDGITYLVSIPCDTLLWLDEPIVVNKELKHKRQKTMKNILSSDGRKPMRADNFARALNDFYWYRHKVLEGTKGAVEYEFARRRVTLSNDGTPSKNVWLLVKRTLGDNPTYYFYMCNAPLTTRLKRFVWLSGIRWSIDQCFEEAKSELGMGHYELRKYTGWNHHMLTCMLAHFFLCHLRITLGWESSVYYSVVK